MAAASTKRSNLPFFCFFFGIATSNVVVAHLVLSIDQHIFFASLLIGFQRLPDPVTLRILGGLLS